MIEEMELNGSCKLLTPSSPSPPPFPHSRAARGCPTCDIDFHQARACPDGVGGLADVGAGHAVGHGPFEVDGVVLDFHTPWQGPVWPGGDKDHG